MLDQITPLLLTFDEAPNIERTLSRLNWAKEIIVIDSFSTDETCDLVRKLPQTTLVQRQFDNHTNQWNFGLEQVRTDWVLSLDADYMLSFELVEELETLPHPATVQAYFARFRYCIHGRPLRGSLYPPRAVLFRRESCRYADNGHTQVLQVKGASEFLRNWIYHDDRKPLDRWIREQDRYARLEAEYLMRTTGPRDHGTTGLRDHGTTGLRDYGTTGPRDDTTEGQRAVVSGHWSAANQEFSLADRIRRKIILAPFLVFFYTLFGKGLVLDGWPGWFYVFQRTYAEVLLSLRLLEKRLAEGPQDYRTTGLRDRGRTGPIG